MNKRIKKCAICGATGVATRKHKFNINESNAVLHLCKECKKRFNRMEELKLISRKAVKEIEEDLISRAGSKSAQMVIHQMADDAIKANRANFKRRLEKGIIEEYHLKKCSFCGKWVFEHTEYCFHCIQKCEYPKLTKEQEKLYPLLVCARETVYITAGNANIEKSAGNSEINYVDFAPTALWLLIIGGVFSITQGGLFIILGILMFIIYGFVTQSTISDYYHKVEEDVDNTKRTEIKEMLAKEKNAKPAIEKKKYREELAAIEKKKEEQLIQKTIKRLGYDYRKYQNYPNGNINFIQLANDLHREELKKYEGKIGERDKT